MDEDRLGRLLEEIRDLQRQQVEAYARALNNQQEALRIQREGMGRARKVLAGLGLVIVIVLVIVLVLLRYILQHYAEARAPAGRASQQPTSAGRPA